MFKYSEYVYYLMYIVGFAIMMVIDLKTYKAHGIKKKSAISYTLLTYAYGVIGAMIMGKVYTYFSHLAGSLSGSRVAIFGAVIFTPLFLLVNLKLQKKDAGAYMDMLTPGIFVILACAKFGCFLNGCCAGFPCEHGICIYNPQLEMKVFPVQIFEVISMIALICITQNIFKSSKWYVKGMAYPVTAAAYSVIRFCWEFARYYIVEELGKVFLGFTFWQLWCLFVFISSVVSIICIKKCSKDNEFKRAVPTKRKNK